jgi:hypothetical protein
VTSDRLRLRRRPRRPGHPGRPTGRAGNSGHRALTRGAQRLATYGGFDALRWAPAETLANLARLARDFDVYTPWGFRDSVNVDTGVVSDSYLSLDQGIIMAAIGNALGGDFLRRLFVSGSFERALRPRSGSRSSTPSRAAARSRAPPPATTWSAAAATT